MIERLGQNMIEQWGFFEDYGSITNGSNTKTIPKTF